MITELPLEVLRVIDELLKINKKVAVRIKDENSIIHFIGRGKYSNFIFVVEKYYEEEGDLQDSYKFVFKIVSYPYNERELGTYSLSVSPKFVITHFEKWLALLTAYPKYEYLDNYTYESDIEEIVKEIEKNFDFEILDEEKDSKFDMMVQFKLLDYLDYLIEKSESYKDETNKESIDEIISDAKTLQTQLTKLTKAQVGEKFKKIWAKSKETSLKLFREVVIKALAELIVKGINGHYPPFLEHFLQS